MSHPKNQDGHVSIARVSITVTIIALAAALAAALAYIGTLNPAATPTATVIVTRPPVDTVALNAMPQINAQAASLLGTLPRYTPIYKKAEAVRAAIIHGDFQDADRAIGRIFAESKIAYWHFDPYATFVRDLTGPGNARFAEQLDAWIAQDPHSPTPYLLRAMRERNAGWAARGSGFVSGITRDHMEQFGADMNKAAKDVLMSMRLDPTNPYGSYVLLSVLGAAGNTHTMEYAFQNAIRRFPGYYPLYWARLNSLQPKWGGTIAGMYRFVDRYAGRAPAYAPLRMLYLELYGDLVNAAALSCTVGNTVSSRCVTGTLSQIVTEDLNKNTYAVFEMYDHVNRALFSFEVGHILVPIIETSGARRAAAVLLQGAAHGMHSDDARVANDTVHNNFMADQMTALVWYQAGQFDNAEELLKRAVTDLHNTRFQSDDQRGVALGDIYHDLAKVYSQEHHYQKVVAYQKAANVLTGPGHRDVECAALYQIKLYRNVLSVCGRQIRSTGDGQAYYWRAGAYAALNHVRRALLDYRHVASSQSAWRGYAAIEISVLYDQKHDVRDSLRALNAYPYLYDPKITDKETVAIAYNNRCYAEKQLGELRRALRDCTVSLRFGNLPDAYAKEQELIRELKTKGEVGAPGAAVTNPPEVRREAHARTF